MPVFVSVDDPLCMGMHFECMDDRKTSRDRRDKPKAVLAAGEQSATLRRKERDLNQPTRQPQQCFFRFISQDSFS